MLNIQAIKTAEAAHSPFPFFKAQVLGQDELAEIRADFPIIEKPGLFPVETLSFGPRFVSLLSDIHSPALSEAIGEKLGVDLEGLPQMVTVRGHAQAKDGRIHTDTKDKVATCLLYLNGAWDEGGGRLRLLRSGNIEDYILEVPPNGGTLVAFKVSENSWHGHKPFVGERRYVMVNWLRSDGAHARHLARHQLSASVKRLLPFFYRGGRS
ncbi:MAG TPA: 2OG-Fe(II) oxygenase [Hyphomicrobiales bacterium]|nr:2OG-Fe(II) oxygenase [Hyphomicrobiales bacterium]